MSSCFLTRADFSAPTQHRVPALRGRVPDRSRGGGVQVHGPGVVADAADAQSVHRPLHHQEGECDLKEG